LKKWITLKFSVSLTFHLQQLGWISTNRHVQTLCFNNTLALNFSKLKLWSWQRKTISTIIWQHKVNKNKNFENKYKNPLSHWNVIVNHQGFCVKIT
jgi:hypothetical protein